MKEQRRDQEEELESKCIRSYLIESKARFLSGSDTKGTWTYIGELVEQNHSTEDGTAQLIPDGNGFLRWDIGDFYVGSFKNGKKHGNGTYFPLDGPSKNSIWVADKPIDHILSQTIIQLVKKS